MADSFDVKVSTETESVVQKLYRASVTWRILNFENRSYLLNAFIRSPEFHHADASWVLYVYPNGTRASKGVVNVSLLKMRSRILFDPNHVVSAKFLVPCNGGQDKTREVDKMLLEGAVGCNPLEIVDRKEVLKKNSGYLENGAFTIKCDMTVFGEITEHCKGRNPSEYDFPSTGKDDTAALLVDIEELHLNPKFADVMLKLGKQEFPAHKLILRTRSKVFEAMFEHDMQENRQNTIDLVDMEVHTVKDMLSYIYTGKMRQLSTEDALGLYVAADRYDLQKLVFNCRKIMLNELSIDNICEIAAVADLHNDQLLMDAVKSFLYKNMKEIFKTEKWALFAKKNPILSLNFIQAAVINN